MVNLVTQPSASPLAPLLAQERADPRLALARILADQNNASANVPLLNPMSTLARAIAGIAPSLIQMKVAGDYQDRQNAAAEHIQKAVKGISGGGFTTDNPEGAFTELKPATVQPVTIQSLAAALSGNPDTAPYALNLQMMDAVKKDDRAYQTGERKDTQAFTAGESDKTRTFQGGENAANRDLTRSEGSANRGLTAAEGAANRGQQTALATQQQNFTREENVINRAHQLMVEDKKLSAAEAHQKATAELQTREHALNRETTLSAAKIRAGADDPTGGVPIGQNAELAAKLGVPLADSDPYKGLDRKTAQSLYKSNHQRVEKELDAGETEMQAAKNRQQDAKRFMALNSETGTGGVYGAPVVGGVAQGVAGMFSDNLKEMQSITDRLAPRMREPGSGTSSDLDVKKFESALFGPGKDRAVNENIAKAMIQKDQNAIDYQQFKRDYFDTNGHLGGAERAWRTYLNANPIFDPKAKEGTYTLNPGRVPYREFFGTKEAAPAQGASPAAAPASSVPAPPAGFVVQ